MWTRVSALNAMLDSTAFVEYKAISCIRAAIAQLGERQTEDLKVPGSIPGLGIHIHFQNLNMLMRLT